MADSQSSVGRVVGTILIACMTLYILDEFKKNAEAREDARWEARRAADREWFEQAQARCDRINAANGVNA